jgi:hypothetical protein
MQRSGASADTDPPYLFEPVVLPETRGTDYDALASLFDDPQRFATFNLRDTANQIFFGAAVMPD